LDNTAFIPLTNISYEPGESTAELYLEFASDLSETAQIIVKVSDSEGAFVEDTFNVCIYCYPLNIVEQGDKEFQIKLYPNPTNGRVNIDLTTIGNTSKLKVLNSIGEEIFQRNYNFVNHIDFSLLGKESGLYFVILEHGGRIYSRKLVITE
jgi:hypothetical protein